MKKYFFVLIFLPLFALPGCTPYTQSPVAPAPLGELPSVTENPATLPPTPVTVQETPTFETPKPATPPSVPVSAPKPVSTPVPTPSPAPAPAVQPTPAPVISAPNATNFKFVMGNKFFNSSALNMPAKGAVITDPNFHTTIVRITDRVKDGYTGPGIENEYARSSPENADGSRIILRGNDGEWYLYSATDYKLLKHLEITGGGQEPEPRWDATNPKIFYYLYGAELRTYNIDTNVSATARDFSRDISGVAMVTTKTEGDASVDRRYWCFMAQNEADDKTLAVFTYDRVQNKILGKKTTFPNSINWVSSDMNGKHCVIGYDEHIAESFSPDFSRKVQLPDKANGHMDLALDATGRDVMVYQNNATDFIAMANLETGAETALVSIPFDVNGDIGLHFSGNSTVIPGWALISTYGSKNLPPENVSHSWMDNQLFMVELKANPRIWRLAETHAYTSRDFTGEKNYFAEAFAAINTTGTRIYFGSNWGNYTTDYSEAYEVFLPTDWQKYIP